MFTNWRYHNYARRIKGSFLLFYFTGWGTGARRAFQHPVKSSGLNWNSHCLMAIDDGIVVQKILRAMHQGFVGSVGEC